MRKHLIATCALAAIALAASAAPALTASDGTVTLTVTAQAPPAPCLTVTPETLDFGTKPFSTPGGDNSGAVFLTLTNCGTATQHVVAAGTDASGPTGAWALTDVVSGSICSLGTDKYSVFALGPTSGRDYVRAQLGVTPTMLAVSGDPYPLVPSGVAPVTLVLTMPCQGSNGAGATKSLSATFTAIVA
jgi:hypothetical protein